MKVRSFHIGTVVQKGPPAGGIAEHKEPAIQGGIQPLAVAAPRLARYPRRELQPATVLVLVLVRGISDEGKMDKLGDAVDLHLLKHPGAVLCHRLFANPKLGGDLFRMFSGNQQFHHLAFAR